MEILLEECGVAAADRGAKNCAIIGMGEPDCNAWYSGVCQLGVIEGINSARP
jgi:hypothetical protein